MHALAARGNVAEALAAYERLRVLLRDELGVDPSEAVQDAYVRLVDDVVALAIGLNEGQAERRTLEYDPFLAVADGQGF
jgi:DNA-binding SARP family transcriptional activator